MQRIMDDKFFNEVLAHDECAKVRAIYRAIEKWEDVAAGEREARRPDTSQLSEDQAYWAAQNFEDEAFVIHRTKQAMLGSLAVSIFAAVEAFVGAMCLDRGVKLKKRTLWGTKKKKLQDNLDVKFRDLDGFTEADRARVLGNCFKHNEGKANDEFVKVFAGQLAEDEEIDFESYDWPQLI